MNPVIGRHETDRDLLDQGVAGVPCEYGTPNHQRANRPLAGSGGREAMEMTSMTGSPIHQRRSLVLLIALAVIATLVAPLGSHVRAQGNPVAVEIVDFAFNPGSIEVTVGTTITFTNQGQAPHTATSDDGAWDTGQLDNGDSASITFDIAGTFSYHCEFHPTMEATIVVVDAKATAAPTAPAVASTAPAPGNGGDQGAVTDQIEPIAEPHLAHIHAGTCDELGIVVFSLSNMHAYALDGGSVQTIVGTVKAGLEELFSEPFSLHVHQSDAEKQTYIACGEIGAKPPEPWQPGDGFAIALNEQADSGEQGIVSLQPDNAGSTTVTIVLSSAETAPSEVTPAPDATVAPDPTAATNETETPVGEPPSTYVSPTFDYTLSYGPTWTVSEESSDGRQDRFVLTNGTSFVTFVAAQGFGGDPEQCVSGFSEQQVADPNVGNVTPATDAAGNTLRGGTPATGAFAVYNHDYTFDDGRTEPYTLFIGCIPLVPGEAVLSVIQNVPTADYNTEVAAREGLLRGLTLPQR